MKTNSYKVCIVVVTWNNENDILDCLNSLFAQTYKDFRVIVVDNHSHDNTVKIIKQNFTELDLVEETKNHFLTGGNNIGIRLALNKYNPDYVMVINPDTQVQPNLLDVLVGELAKDSKIGAVGPKIKFGRSKYHGLLNSTGLIYDGFMQAYDRGFTEEDKDQYAKSEEVFGVSGTCILYRSQMLRETGLYWNVIKMYLDEVELFIRAKKRGWKVIYTPQTTVEHHYMQSTNQHTDKTYNRQRQMMQAWLLIALRHYPVLRKLAMLKKYFTFKPGKLIV